MPALGHSCSAWLGLVGTREEQATCPGLRNETLQHSGLRDNSCQTPRLWEHLVLTPHHRHASRSAGVPRAGQGMNREGAPGKSPEEMYIQQKVRVLLMLRKMGSNVSAGGVSHHNPQGECLTRAEQRLRPPPVAAMVRDGGC